MLATLFLSQGTPMLLAGDELGNSQGGNNNAYCQDNEISWIDWSAADAELTEFVRQLAAFRRAHVALRQSRFLHARKRPADGLPDVAWRDFKGNELNWRDPSLSSLCVLFRCSAEAPLEMDSDDSVFIIFNRSHKKAEVILPLVPAGRYWAIGVDTATNSPANAPLTTQKITVAPDTVLALYLVPPATTP
jgi:glycogen operon protein